MAGRFSAIQWSCVFVSYLLLSCGGYPTPHAGICANASVAESALAVKQKALARSTQAKIRFKIRKDMSKK